LLKRIGVPQDLERSNVAGVHYPKLRTLDDGLRAKLHGESDLDLEVYQTWLKRLPRSRARLEAELRRR
jgi:hypothetical protein